MNSEFLTTFEGLVINLEDKKKRQLTNSEENWILLRLIRYKLGLNPNINEVAKSTGMKKAAITKRLARRKK